MISASPPLTRSRRPIGSSLGKQRARETVVDDNPPRRRAVGAIERAPAQHPDAERLEGAALDDTLVGRDVDVGLIGAPVGPGVIRAGDWQARHRAGRLDAVDGIEPVLKRDVEVGAALGVAIAADRQVDRERQHVVGTNAEIDVREMLEAAQQQTRAGQQHHRERDLADDQHLPETRLAAAAGGAAP